VQVLRGWVIVLASFAYLGILFAIAFYGDRRAGAGASIINTPYIYALSLAVYATSWTFYGSVGRAAVTGIGFLPIYLGPTLMAALWWTVLRKIIRISKANRITSIADFIASRYGKSAMLAGLATLVAVIGVVPYIALQLKAISASLGVLMAYPGIVARAAVPDAWWTDTTLYIALLLAAFTIVFGTRHLDATERHEGMVAAIAFESLVKLAAFLAVGIFVTFGMYGGFGDLFRHAEAAPALRGLLTMDAGFGGWTSLIVLSMTAILFLPRQFQVAVVENIDEKHLDKAVWLLPLYLLAINVFVLPIAFAGAMHLPQGADADTFVLTLPMIEQRQGLALLVFIGGLSAATGMIIVESIALSTMVCNDLVMPLLLRLKRLGLNRRANLGGLLLAVRRVAIVLLMVLGYAYFRLAGEAAALVSIGLISFAAVAQFAPAMLGGIYWREGTRRGALVGLSAGFLLWIYTLLLPSFAHSGWLHAGLLAEGPFGIGWLKPQQLFGLQGLDPISHGLFWSMLANVGAYVAVSLTGTQGSVERTQAILFVDAYAYRGDALGSRMWSANASTEVLRELLTRFLGAGRSADLFARFEKQQGVASAAEAGRALVHFAEIELAGAIGAASARAAIASVVDEHPPGRDELMAILDEASSAMAYSRELERTSQELRRATDELKAANKRLTELDQMKDDFVSTVTHELRTPLTSIRAFSEILRDHPELPIAKRTEYLGIVIKESERLTRLINEVLDLSKIESGRAEWHESAFDLRQVIVDAVNASSLLFKDKQVQLELGLPATAPQVCADRDRLMQVMLNLLSNAVKFCDKVSGRVTVTMEVLRDDLRVSVSDNGPGVQPQDREFIFEKFRQGRDMLAGKPQGTGLGLPISREIISHFGGRLWLASAAGEGAAFVFTLPQAVVREEAS
jgi:Na+/proline symporter/nitrogen-specific signal transduction histidine kinase